MKSNLSAIVFLIFSASCFGQSKIEPTLSLLPDMEYKLYDKEFDSLPDFSNLTPDKIVRTDTLGVPFRKEKDAYAVRFSGKLYASQSGKYKITLLGGAEGNLKINSALFLEYKNYNSAVIELAQGEHTFEISHLKKKWAKDPLTLIMEPYHLLVAEELLDKKHWLYFGWMEDHPKSISLMGGALYPRRPKLLKMDNHSWDYSKKAWHKNSDDLVLFLLGIDGKNPVYPNETATNRRKTIDWNITENYLPSPISKWDNEGVQISIQHFGRRILQNQVNAVYTRVVITNKNSEAHDTELVVNGNTVAERVFPLKNYTITTKNPHQLILKTSLKPKESKTYDFVIPANGTSEISDIIALGSFDNQFGQMKDEIDQKISRLTRPIALPDDRLVDLWKSSMVNMWNATVKTPIDYEQRGSGGNVYGFYQYDRVFDHDVPDMVIQYILEGDWDIARKIMEGNTYEKLSKGILERERYLDALPKYIVTMAQYLQTTGDKRYFTNALFNKIKGGAHILHDLRKNQLADSLKGTGKYGLIDKGNTLDNGNEYLVVDNFAALHGLVSYKYLCKVLGKPEEEKWADEEMIDLNNSLNNAIDISMKANTVDWYNASFSFDYDARLVSGPGNWFGTTLMMSTFPWNGYLKGNDLEGTWKTYFDNSIDEWMRQSKKIGNPEGSLGAWWSAKYGSIYNAGMGFQMLFSEKHRTFVATSIEWLLENESVPSYWGESFYAPKTASDWTVPAVDLETWGLGYIRQALLQLCLSVHVDGTVIIGRGIPDHWLKSGKAISWKNIRINNGKKLDLTIVKKDNKVHITLNGDQPEGNILLDIPLFVNNISKVRTPKGKVVKKDFGKGKIWCTGDTKNIVVELKR